ncbi:NAD(P)-binding protein [Mollisia scopiformis]|uniref:NAD(P)-binding protein n=1 Tax=Mollisia scopiformis TaxID=149040 RepID=A0A132B902_MOLSC|nr:NAD(P)-binding protein [Mollisia scopiformis]KUJ08354.1 NAD(P)-binding protein [Mollisia scopiformis]
MSNSIFSVVRSFLYSQFLVTPVYPTKPFQGQTIIVTGSNTGLGFEAAQHFVRLNASKVILAVRSTSKGETAKASILSSHPKISASTIEVWPLDLSSYESVKAFAEKANGLERLDAVVENAGIMTKVWTEFEGMESTVTTNVISTELLALLLLPKMRETASRFNVVPRLSIVTSDLHFVIRFEEGKEDDIYAALNRKEGWNVNSRYAVTKLMEIFFVRELAKRMDDSKKPKVIVNCMTPGACMSDFNRESKGLEKRLFEFLAFLLARSTEVGSRTLVAGITADEESHGAYMADCIVTSPSKFVLSDDGATMQKKLWDQTIKLLESIQPGIAKNV